MAIYYPPPQPTQIYPKVIQPGAPTPDNPPFGIRVDLGATHIGWWFTFRSPMLMRNAVSSTSAPAGPTGGDYIVTFNYHGRR